jgi:excisionase family DNA binding protein
LPDQPDQLRSISHAAGRLGVSRATVYRLVHAGELAAVRVGERSTRIADSELDRYIDEHTTLAVSR